MLCCPTNGPLHLVDGDSAVPVSGHPLDAGHVDLVVGHAVQAPVPFPVFGLGHLERVGVRSFPFQQCAGGLVQLGLRLPTR